MEAEYLQNGLVLLQAESLFPLGTDAMVLAHFARIPKGAAVCDLCAGGGAVGMLLLARDRSLKITAVELQPEACDLMVRTVEKNGLQGSFRVLPGDIRRIPDLLDRGSFRQVVCNPPYYPAADGIAPEREAEAIARTELFCTLEDVCAAARWLLPEKGSLWLVHKPERLADLICRLREQDLEPKRLRFVTHQTGKAPSLVLLRAVKGGKPGLALDPELVLHGPDGSPTEEYRKIYHMP